jgi:hypothetical protein
VKQAPPVAVAERGDGMVFLDRYGVRPVTFLIDRDGVIQDTFIGPLSSKGQAKVAKLPYRGTDRGIGDRERPLQGRHFCFRSNVEVSSRHSKADCYNLYFGARHATLATGLSGKAVACNSDCI